jgi:hypothetical protein
MFCPLRAKAASKFVVESVVFGSQPGNLFAVDVDLLPERLDGCRLVAGFGRRWRQDVGILMSTAPLKI